MTLEEELTPILAEVQILSPAAFMFKGEIVAVTPGHVSSVPGLPTHPLPEMPLVRDLQGMLYARCYVRRMTDLPPTPLPVPFTPEFLTQLSQSNCSRAGWEGGWTIYQVSPNGQVWLVKGDRQRVALPGEFITNGPPGVPIQPGTAVDVQVPRESTIAQQGFYYAYGEKLGDVWDEQTLVRFYFHAPAIAVPDLIHHLTQLLNRYGIPFRLKALNNPVLYERTDAVVLYVARRYYHIMALCVFALPAYVTSQLRPSTPLFTRSLQPGIGVAEDPNTGESFGMHRTRLVAEGIVDAWKRGDQSLEGRLRAIATYFAQSGTTIHLPHIGAGSVDLPSISSEVSFAYA